MLVELVDTFDLESIAQWKRKRSSRLYCNIKSYFYILLKFLRKKGSQLGSNTIKNY